MSPGFSAANAIFLTQLARSTLQEAWKACGEEDELHLEVQGIYSVLFHLQCETEKANTSILDRSDELIAIATGCQKVLNIVETVLKKYNALSAAERSKKKLWRRIRFGNGQTADLDELRGKLAYYASTIKLLLNIGITDTAVQVEKETDDASKNLRKMKIAVDKISARLISRYREEENSGLTSYEDDDRVVWKRLRRELIEDGLSNSTVHKHKADIESNITELGDRGLLDKDDASENNDELHHPKATDEVPARDNEPSRSEWSII